MNRILSLTLLTTTQLLVGCGGGTGGGQPVFPVSGTVTMFGKPLAKATVAFAPQADQATAIGTTDNAGNFKLSTYEHEDGAAEGSYKVVVSKTAAVASAAAAGDDEEEGAGHDSDDEAAGDHDSGEGETSTELVPQQYTNAVDTPFSADVKSSGENIFTFDIK
ncbi:MAG: carboxypeptidase regulatory-like domain-containing protein [Fuerstiella sp.]|nr:carboxypeptidase regulatory-like domain-containing protein [Fuerstiella sp.]MCP4784285.1 carboxypeptidase regulatory-like domain-containing protein [Fuerstiella sp.]MCP4855905.1 carboxypeptidase regulatory-like domain-containing protein [Fuerstiella sp.]